MQPWYLAQLLSWSDVDILLGCAFAVEALGLALLWRMGGRLRRMMPFVPLVLGGWAFGLRVYALGAYDRLAAGPCPGCRSFPFAVQERWFALTVETSTLVRLETIFLIGACTGCLVVLLLRRRPSGWSRTALPGALVAGA